jgi:tetratricopeptide (TPR) repeat protein
VKVPFRLRRVAPAAPAEAVWLPSADAAGLLAVCAALGEGAWPPVYALAGGFLVKMPGGAYQARSGSEGTPASLAGASGLVAGGLAGSAFPGGVRLRALGTNLFLPADAELEPALLEDESSALAGKRGLVFLPGGRVLAFDPGHPLKPADLLGLAPLPRRDWRPPPEKPARPERLREVLLDRPDDTPDVIIERGGSGLGVESPRAPDAGAAATAAGHAEAGVGRALAWLGAALGWKGLARLGAGLMGRAVRRVPRVGEWLLGRQESALRELLRRFREGDEEEALRRALPLGGEAGRGGEVAGDARLPVHDLFYRLGDLLGSGRGPASWWLGGADLRAELESAYTRAAEAATARGDYRRAAFIYGKLLGDYRLAAGVLERGGLHHDAGVLYLERVGDALAAARAFESAGEVDRALALYRERGEHLLAGDLLRRVGEEEQALEEYKLAASRLMREDNYCGAGELFLKRAGRPDLALACFEVGWGQRPGSTALACLPHLARLYAEQPRAGNLLRLVGEADEFLATPGLSAPAGEFYNELAHLAGRENLAGVRDELRDRALRGLAGLMRRGAAQAGCPPDLASALFGRSGEWPAALVRDAGVALGRAVRGRAGPGVRHGAARVRTVEGSVTAVCAAGRSGDLFLGFADGTVVWFQPRTGAQVRLKTYPWPVVSLATDPEGLHLLVVNDPPGAAQLTHYAVRGGALLVGTSRAPSAPDPGPALLSPVVTGGGEPAALLWDGARLTLLSGADFLPVGTVAAPFDPPDVVAPLLLSGPGGAHVALVLTREDPSSLWFTDPSAFDVPGAKGRGAVATPRWQALALGWHPEAAPGSSLGSPVVGWHDLGGSQLLAGVGDAGVLHWSVLAVPGRGPARVVARNTHFAEGGYRAAALLPSGRVAGVSRSGVCWLRGGTRPPTVYAVTRADLGDAVACAFSPGTGELLVVCAGGDVVRVPAPG